MSDVEYVIRRAQRGRIAFVLAIVALAGAVSFAIYTNAQQDNQITRIESPCLHYGSKSKQCKEAFEAAVLTVTHAEACAILRKAGLEITNCAGARLKQEQGRSVEREANGGGASTGNPPSSQPGPSPGGSGGVGTHPANPPPPASGGPPPSESPATPSPPAAEPTQPAVTAVEGVGQVAEGALGTVCTALEQLQKLC